MRIVITGAAGKIGRQIVEELSGAHDLILIDKRSVPGVSSITAELSRCRRQSVYAHWLGLNGASWTKYLKGADVVLHLAAERSPQAPWKKVLRENIEATWNVCDAASRHHVPRVVFASSNYAVKALENELAPACYEPQGPKIGSEVPPRPLTAYGVSKALGEIIGQTFVAEGRLQSFVAVRIGAFSAIPSTASPWRHLWIGTADIRSLLRRCIEKQFSGFHVVYGVSAQPTIPYDLSHTRGLLSWMPQEQYDREIRCAL
jgi:nucleoside-diphosphate-sugar epimerase